ncbi:MAG: hypothetical protein GXO79_12495 [Chlorobi bacterium]|nr:hypothetical protein [Chlorobiota bacterium]
MNNKKKLIIVPLFLILLMTSCKDKEIIPSIIIKDDNAKEINNDTLIVALNSTHQTLVDVIYEEGSDIKYLRQVDNKDIENLTPQLDNDINFITNGRDENGYFENVVITTKFLESKMSNGTIVKITVQINTDLAESVYYKVE